MNKKLFFEAIIKYLLGVIIVGILIFIPAGTIHFINGWLFLGVLFIPMLIAGIVMMFKDPTLLASRLDAKEKFKSQGIIVKLFGLTFIVGFIVAGLDFRFNWFSFQFWISIIASVILIIGYLLWAEVLRENKYVSRTIGVVDNQIVIDTGLYGIIRHPMYLASIIVFISIPIILGSLFSLIAFIFYPILIVIRIINEEKYLDNNLDGYKEYKKKVRYRLIPFIW